jgi:hypothetical protein
MRIDPAEEFPDYRFLPRVSGTSNTRLCNEVFDAYLAHCEARLRRGDMVGVTVTGYRKVIDGVWRPHLGKLVFSQVRYSRLIRIADGRCWSKKIYNNAVSVLKRAFDFVYRDRPFHENPALKKLGLHRYSWACQSGCIIDSSGRNGFCERRIGRGGPRGTLGAETHRGRVRQKLQEVDAGKAGSLPLSGICRKAELQYQRTEDKRDISCASQSQGRRGPQHCLPQTWR